MSLAGLLLCALALAAMPACRFGKKDFSNENDRLRRELMETRSELERMRARASELETKLAEAEHLTTFDLSADALDALPRAAGVSISRLSGLLDSDGDGTPDTVEMHIAPYDGRRRFVQVAGRLLAEASALPPLEASEEESAGSERPLGAVSLSPVELREAYRAGFGTGSHYTVRIPLPEAAEPLSREILLRVELLDAVSGRQFTDQRVIRPRTIPN